VAIALSISSTLVPTNRALKQRHDGRDPERGVGIPERVGLMLKAGGSHDRVYSSARHLCRFSGPQ
jgi:hypothetical protein